MLKAVKFVSIPTADQDRALRFWTEKLGLAVHTDQPFDENQRWIELRIKGAETNLVLFTTEADKSRIGGFMNVSFVCDNLDKTYDEMKAAGVEFAGPPQKAQWGSFVIFKDADGNSFVMSQR